MRRELPTEIQERLEPWKIDVEDFITTSTSIVVLGNREERSIVLKIALTLGDEWRAGEVLEKFGGRGVVRVLEHIPGVVLLERLRPAESLSMKVRTGQDDDATAIMANVMQRMSRTPSLNSGFSTVEDWGRGFARYLRSPNQRIEHSLVLEAQRIYQGLCGSQRTRRLLHGDLHHDNVLFDENRGWTAIDPKGVIGELEFEVGACLRNPIDLPELWTDPARIEARLRIFESTLGLDRNRAAAWSFAQAVLSAIWMIEDNVVGDNPRETASGEADVLGRSVQLASALRRSFNPAFH